MTFLYIAIGLVAGILSGIFGIGGGIVIVPALVYFARMPLITATGFVVRSTIPRLSVRCIECAEHERRVGAVESEHAARGRADTARVVARHDWSPQLRHRER